MSLHTGTIERGTGRAGKFGFPTINIALKDSSVYGIYAALVVVDGISYNSAVYADRRRNLLEAYLLDFSGELYGREAGIKLIQKIRDDKVFDNDAALAAAIADDIKKAREYFKMQS